jgi:hypothetical protein
VRKVRATLVVALLICAGARDASAESAPTWEGFEAVKRIGAPWAYDAFLQQYPAGYYADLAREHIAYLAGQLPSADLSRITGAVQASPAIDTSRIGEANYGDGFFMRRHLKLQR